MRLLFKFNPDAFRFLLFYYTPVIPLLTLKSSLPEIFDLDKFKKQFENEISKLKKEVFKTPSPNSNDDKTVRLQIFRIFNNFIDIDL